MADRALLPIVCGAPYGVVRPRQSHPRSTVSRPITETTGPVSGATYGERIAVALKRAGKTKQWLADAINVQWQTVHSWTTGKHEPDGANIAAAAEALEMTPAELLGVLDGQDPPFAAWSTFLSTSDGQSITPEERRSLAAIPWPKGRQPTVASYQVALTSLRTTEPRI